METKFSTGIDIIEIERIKHVLKKHNLRFLKRIYTDDEVKFCRGRTPELQARFAAKEAVMKALGTGTHGVSWKDIEVLPNKRGKPLVFLYGRAAIRAEKISLRGLDISLSHSKEYALASVVGERALSAEEDSPRFGSAATELIEREGLR